MEMVPWASKCYFSTGICKKRDWFIVARCEKISLKFNTSSIISVVKLRTASKAFWIWKTKHIEIYSTWNERKKVYLVPFYVKRKKTLDVNIYQIVLTINSRRQSVYQLRGGISMLDRFSWHYYVLLSNIVVLYKLVEATIRKQSYEENYVVNRRTACFDLFLSQPGNGQLTCLSFLCQLFYDCW